MAQASHPWLVGSAEVRAGLSRPHESLFACSPAALPCLVLRLDQVWIRALCLLWQLPGSGWLSRGGTGLTNRDQNPLLADSAPSTSCPLPVSPLPQGPQPPFRAHLGRKGKREGQGRASGPAHSMALKTGCGLSGHCTLARPTCCGLRPVGQSKRWCLMAFMPVC